MLVNTAQLFEIAADALCGVGDAAIGEWREVGDHAVHLRRRLSDRERRAAGNLDVVDVRGTDDHVQRVLRLRPFLPTALQGLAVSEMI